MLEGICIKAAVHSSAKAVSSLITSCVLLVNPQRHASCGQVSIRRCNTADDFTALALPFLSLFLCVSVSVCVTVSTFLFCLCASVCFCLSLSISLSVSLSVFVCRPDRLTGLVVKASASRAEDPAFESRLLRDFFGVE